jgi:hypothetical protein
MKYIWMVIFFLFLSRVIKKAIDEAQARTGGQTPGQQKKPAPRPLTSAQARTPAKPEPASWELGQQMPGEGVSDLEKMFGEAMKRKRQLDGSEEKPPEPVQPKTVQTRATRPRAPQTRAPQPRAKPMQVEPRVEHRREVGVRRSRVAMPQEPVAVEPELKRPEPAHAVPKGRGEKRARRRGVHQRSSVSELPGIGRLGKRSIRRSIVMAEILGTPKGLRDIDSHVI